MRWLELAAVLVGGALIAIAAFLVHDALGFAAAGAFLLWLGTDREGPRGGVTARKDSEPGPR